jgi:outer membrane protease
MARSRRAIALGLLLLPLLCASPAPAQGPTLEVQSRTGVLFGLVRELVYYGANILSELDWRFQPVVYAGTALKLQTSMGVSAVVDVRSAFPGRSGYMGDWDAGNYLDGDFTRTHYSQQDCYTERALLLDARLGWVFRLGPVLTLEPFGAFGLMQLKWSARDGYLQYPTVGPPYPAWSPSLPKVPVSGTAIIYEQTYLIPGAGFSVGAVVGRRFHGELRFLFSPFLFCNDLDNHVQRAGFGEAADVDFHDYLRGGFLIEPGLRLGLQVSPRARLSLDLSYRGVFALIGDTAKVLAGPGLTPGEIDEMYSDGAGTTYSALDACLALSLSL